MTGSLPHGNMRLIRYVLSRQPAIAPLRRRFGLAPCLRLIRRKPPKLRATAKLPVESGAEFGGNRGEKRPT